MFSPIIKTKFIVELNRVCDTVVKGYQLGFINKPELEKEYINMVRIALESSSYESYFVDKIIEYINQYIYSNSCLGNVDAIYVDFDNSMEDIFDKYEEEYERNNSEE